MLCRCAFVGLALVATTAPAFAQNWTFDARKIGIGAAGDIENLSTRMIEEEGDDRSIVLPFGLIQVLRDLDVFRPGSERFDLVRSVEYAAAPLHHIVGRDAESDRGRRFTVDIRNARLSRDLNTYRGFVPANQPKAEGLASPGWGGTIKLHRGDRGAFQGVYAGAGPYLSLQTSVDIDPRVTGILGSDVDIYLPDAAFQFGVLTRGQAALALTGGYRGRFAWPEGIGAGTGIASELGGVYVALNYNYLRGLRYENVDTALRLDTDRSGLLTINPAGGAPLLFSREHAASGAGRSIDVGVGAVLNRWVAGFGVRGVGNRIDWTGARRTTYALGNLFQGQPVFVADAPITVGDVRVTLPVDYRTDLLYRADRWTAAVEIGRGFQGTSFRGGYERRLGPFDIRAGGAHTRGRWQPTTGIGLNVGSRLALDLALYGTSANVERTRRPAVAVSLRVRRS